MTQTEKVVTHFR